MSKESAFAECLEVAIAKQIFPGCTFVYLADEEEIRLAEGHFTYDEGSPIVSVNTCYDTASLTKVIATTTLATRLIDEGALSLQDSVSTYLPEYRVSKEKQAATILHLLTYTIDYNIPGGSKSLMSGLSPEAVAQNALNYPLSVMPGTTYLYSNLTAFILTQVMESATGRRFDELVREKIFTPLQMHTATFAPAAAQVPNIPPTEITAERGVVQGFVHDEFSYYTRSGGIGNGAAGLFASISDIENFLRMTLGRGKFGDVRIISEALVEQWTQDMFPDLLPTHTPLAWGDLNNAMLDTYHRNIVVKGGFTGCFMLADLTKQRAFVLLSNRTYPTRPDDNEAFSTLKTQLAAIALG